MYESGYNGSVALFGGLFWAAFAVLYLFFAVALYKIAQKCRCHNEAWWGFVPILNVLLSLKCASRPMYWFIFMMIPIVNIVIAAIVWTDIAKAVGKHPIWGILCLLPFINFVALGVLAFGESSTPTIPPTQPTSPREPAGVA